MTTLFIGNRVPRAFFRTQGSGQSDITVHAGSFHLALKAAGIQGANILHYSSILPAGAREVDRAEALDQIVHGEVMETIMAVAHCKAGESATAAIIFGWLYDPESNQRVGGLVCEYGGPAHPGPRPLNAHLNDMLDELHLNGYEHLILSDRQILSETVSPTKRYGTALVALCFTSYEYPVRGSR